MKTINLGASPLNGRNKMRVIIKVGFRRFCVAMVVVVLMG